MTSAPTTADLEAIQGLVYSGWNDHLHAGFLFATLGPDPASSRRWLDGIRRDITPVARHRRQPHGRLQLAISPSGLAALGVPGDVIGMLPPEAQAGMAARQRSLGDPDPASWQLGGPTDRLDVLVMIYAHDPERRASQLAEQRRALEACGATVRPDELGWPLGQREHFGFADGLSQPYLAGLHPAPRPGEDRIAVGEILLGYPNAYGKLPITPWWDDIDLGKNGSYLVFRKLDQDVAGFWGWINRHAHRLADGNPDEAARLTEWIGAKLIGRWRSGASLVHSPDRDDRSYATPDRFNDFKYLVDDADGMRCPLSSHVRRANPRDARGGPPRESETVVSRHRILRRGRSYGSPLDDVAARTGRNDGTPRGLYFMCLQSSIARGFEFIQQSWLANPGFLGLCGELDPLISNSAGSCHITIPTEPVRLRLANAPTVVTCRGGGYFFLPSLPALARIAAGP